MRKLLNTHSAGKILIYRNINKPVSFHNFPIPPVLAQVLKQCICTRTLNSHCRTSVICSSYLFVNSTYITRSARYGLMWLTIIRTQQQHTHHSHLIARRTSNQAKKKKKNKRTHAFLPSQSNYWYVLCMKRRTVINFLHMTLKSNVTRNKSWRYVFNTAKRRKLHNIRETNANATKHANALNVTKGRPRTIFSSKSKIKT